MEDPSSPQPYGAPYDKADADLILKSTDGKLFSVHKAVICSASAFFRDFPFGISTSEKEHSPGGHPIVPVSDDSKSMVAFLNVIYRGPHPNLGLSNLQSVLEMGRKYQAEVIADRVATLLLSSDTIRKDPIMVYAIASAFGMTEVAAVAARFSLSLSQESVVSLLARETQPDTSGSSYGALFRYRARCAEEIRTGISDGALAVLVKTNATWVWYTCTGSSGRDPCRKAAFGPKATNQLNGSVDAPISVCRWWIDYVTRAKVALDVASDASVLLDPKLLGPAFISAAACTACNKKATVDLDDFLKSVQTIIEGRIAKASM